MGRAMGLAVGPVLALIALVIVADPVAAPPDGASWYVQSNLAGGRADGAEVRGVDDVVVALADRILALTTMPRAVFLNEACESHGAHLAERLGPEWRAFFVQAWPGRSDCFPAPGESVGRAGNAVLIADAGATRLTIPSCNDAGAAPDRCLPNWAPPAEQRAGVCAATEGDLLCSVHLDPGQWQWHDEQLRVLGTVAAALGAEYDSIVVGGDLNDAARDVRRAFDVGGPVRFVDVGGGVPTMPAGAPRRAIDHVLVGSRYRAVRAGSHTIDLGRCEATHDVEGRCSDHRTLVAGVVAR